MQNVITRTNTKQIKIGNISIGGQDKVLIQSMCNIKTSRFEEVAKQINDCAALGADIMRVSVLDMEDAIAIKEIKSRISIPLVADIHFDYRLALQSIESGADVIRINPGNIGGDDKIKAVVDSCKAHNVAIRVGVNSGSIDKNINNNNNKVIANELVESAKRTVKILEDLDFYNVVISLKGSDVLGTGAAYTLAAKTFSYRLHLVITEAGPKDVGVIRSVAGLSPLLINGIGDTIRISLSDDPVEEVKSCVRLLSDLGILKNQPRLISCPTCGRTQVDLIPLSNKILKFIEENHIVTTVAIMGCIVNGPGEAKRADIGVAGGHEQWVLFKKGEIIRNIKDKDVYDELTKELLKMKD
ncbi:MAG: flavodoxin-dependent (E)-4-hydroxy-3-methylbut-2-enyl-diphosphate synthase [Bacilli bacterium]|nr:flavodoxin-dependent (E)-4-hydroxy-3-methylbut-2-enyl-diphosphate synthase [Bacilli bacterium]